MISGLRYRLDFKLSATAPQFSGVVSADFTAIASGEPLTVDFEGGQVAAVAVNKVPVKDFTYNGHFITLPAAAVKSGANQLTIHFEHPYSQTGSGLYRFKDPEDGKIYIYSDFEPYDANRLFPCFDQPDLKATYTLAVDAPAAWTVISSAREAKVAALSGALKHWDFPETKRFSTYLFSLHAGDYKQWQSTADKIPLRLFARQSMAKYIDAEEWFKFTRQGLAFFQSYFDFAYPFGKFDQVIVPDFNAGAMENVAAITYSERYFPRGPSTRENSLNRAGVILHEMAHQWFGDLVTMTWWNDLWLNESFATYMASLAMAEATEFKESWLDFFGEKSWAYFEDQLVTTHPIEGQVPDTEQAFANFDGITYGKGASVLKQLSFYLGAEKFRGGVRAYFQSFQYGNARLPDFIGALALASGQNLNAWSEDWLRTSGVNGLAAAFTCDGGKITTFALNQKPSADTGHSLRSHRTKVGLYSNDQTGAIVLTKAVPVAYQGTSTLVPELIGDVCPSLVFPNLEDNDYAKVALDDRSLTLAKTKLSMIADPHLRLMVWHSLWSMVRDGELPLSEYARTILAQVPMEKDVQVLAPTLATVNIRRRNTAASVVGYLADAGTGAAFRKEFLASAAQLFLAQANSAVPGSDLQKLYFDNYIQLGEFPEAAVQLEALLSNKLIVKGIKLDQDQRWALLFQLSARGAKTAAALRQKELKSDRSSAGRLAGIEAEAAAPVKAAKDHWYGEITDPHSKRSLAELKAAMRGLFPKSQEMWRRQFSERFFKDLATAVTARDSDFLRPFAGNLVPAGCDEASAAALKTFIASHLDSPASVLKSLRVTHQEDERCAMIRKIDSEPAKIPSENG